MSTSIIYNPPTCNPQILHIDNAIIIVNKPPGLLSVPGRGELKKDCLITRIQQDYPEALIVHRLDMPTSGILVLARSTEVHKKLSKLFQDRKVSKEYIAVVIGIMESTAGEIDLPLITDWPNRPKQMVDYENGKPSKTKFEVILINKDDNTSRLKLTPITGRSHQLRVHLLSIGHRIVGDHLYADEASSEKLDSRLLLHASTISFVHPTTQSEISVNCPCDF